jgi:hypothetical protein
MHGRGKSRRRLVVSLLLLGFIWLVAGGHELVRRVRAGGAGELVTVGFTSRPVEADDSQVREMVDEVIEQVFGPSGLSSIVKPGDKVVVKVNIVEPKKGATGDRGRGTITDPRIVRYVCEKVRAIIGTGGTADLRVADACFNVSSNPSDV